MIKTKNFVVSAVIIAISVGALFLLLASSSIPIFTVKELIDHPQTDSFINRKIQLIGVVKTSNGTNFYVNDPDEVNNDSLIIYIEAVNVEKPTGFEIGKTVLVEGQLL